jgi:hypothetical protein
LHRLFACPVCCQILRHGFGYHEPVHCLIHRFEQGIPVTSSRRQHSRNRAHYPDRLQRVDPNVRADEDESVTSGIRRSEPLSFGWVSPSFSVCDWADALKWGHSTCPYCKATGRLFACWPPVLPGFGKAQASGEPPFSCRTRPRAYSLNRQDGPWPNPTSRRSSGKWRV